MMETIPLFTVDAFADLPFHGNPAAVMLIPHGMETPDSLLLNIAAENNLSETAFLQPISREPEDSWERGSKFRLRWFTPTNEVDLCGHATLATAKVDCLS